VIARALLRKKSLKGQGAIPVVLILALVFAAFAVVEQSVINARRHELLRVARDENLTTLAEQLQSALRDGHFLREKVLSINRILQIQQGSTFFKLDPEQDFRIMIGRPSYKGALINPRPTDLWLYDGIEVLDPSLEPCNPKQKCPLILHLTMNPANIGVSNGSDLTIDLSLESANVKQTGPLNPSNYQRKLKLNTSLYQSSTEATTFSCHGDWRLSFTGNQENPLTCRAPAGVGGP
jgi:hypothetical protein